MDQDRLNKHNEFLHAGYALKEGFVPKDVFIQYPLEDGVPTSIAGRIVQIMNAGGIIFIHIERDNHLSQLVISKKESPTDHLIARKYLQTGDIVGAEGVTYTTSNGTLSLKVQENGLHLLTKCFEWFGKTLSDDSLLSDKEELHRYPYKRLNVRRDDRDVFIYRSKLLRALRERLHENDFVELTTRILVHTNGGANARPFVTHHNAIGQDRFLRIAPELDLKRAIVAGFDAIYEIGPNFRNEGIDHTHNPEFTTLEAYKTYTTYQYWVDFFTSFYDSVASDSPGYRTPWVEMTMTEFVAMHHRLDEGTVPYDSLLERFEELMNMESMGQRYPYLIITEHPCTDSPLAKKSVKDSRFVDRAEIYIKGIEIANMYSENVDPIWQEFMFNEQLKQKDNQVSMDKDYIRALEYGAPPMAGIGIGIERLIMSLTQKSSIKDVILFPAYKSRD
jgi:lysyl-tRNA synthetase class 2